MALIDTDKNGLGAGSHRQPGSAEVLLGSSLLEQHPTALIETPLQGGARTSESTPPTPNLKTSHLFPRPAFEPCLKPCFSILQQIV